MRIALSILLLFLFASLTPQQQPKQEISTTYKINSKPYIDYDSIVNDILNKYRSVEIDKKATENQNIYIESKHKEAVILKKEINSNIKKLNTKQDTIIIQQHCMSCYSLDTLKIE